MRRLIGAKVYWTFMGPAFSESLFIQFIFRFFFFRKLNFYQHCRAAPWLRWGGAWIDFWAISSAMKCVTKFHFSWHREKICVTQKQKTFYDETLMAKSEENFFFCTQNEIDIKALGAATKRREPVGFGCHSCFLHSFSCYSRLLQHFCVDFFFRHKQDFVCLSTIHIVNNFFFFN